MRDPFSTPRHLVVVDLETTGLDATRHVPLEVAAINLDTDEVISFVPHLSPDHLAQADHDALRINRYFERGVYRDMLDWDQTAIMYRRLFSMLRGNTFGGANPRFDAEMLIHAPGGMNTETWHHRLADVSAYAAGATGLYPSELEGLADCCKRFDVTNDAPHSALGDVKATAEVFRKALHR